MSGDFALTNLTHHFLIAMPGLEDGLFSKSVVYLCEHSARGALGIIINKPADIKLTELFGKVDLPLRRADLAHAAVFQGGPLHEERGFVLHEPLQPDAPVGASASYVRVLCTFLSTDIFSLAAKGVDNIFENRLIRSILIL